MKITIVGGGNIGTQFAVHCAEKNHEVTVYTSQPGVFDGRLNIVGVIVYIAPSLFYWRLNQKSVFHAFMTEGIGNCSKMK